MNCRVAVRKYVERILETSGLGMKALIMDKLTSHVITQVYTMSQLAKNEVFLIEGLQEESSVNTLLQPSITPLPYVKALVLVRATSENIRALCHELSRPKFGKYYIFFTNRVSRQDISQLAEADRNELVEQVQQFYCDFLPLGAELWTVPTLTPIIDNVKSYTSSGLNQCRDSIFAFMASLNKNLGTVRFDCASKLGSELAKELIRYHEQSNSNFTENKNQSQNSKSSKLNLYIFDRRCDAITPLLMNWTYRAMLHELLTIQRSQIDLTNVPGIDLEMQKISLDADFDDFYAENMLLNYGDVSSNAQKLIQKFQKEKSAQSKIDSISDMKAFLERYPTFKKLQSMTSKHLTLIGELQKRVNSSKLFKVSEYEQNLVSGNCSNMVSEFLEIIKDGNVKDKDCLKLAAMFAARDMNNGNVEKILDLPTLKSRNIKALCSQLINKMKKYQRPVVNDNLGPWGFGNIGPSIYDSLKNQDLTSFTKRIARNVQNEISNITTGNTPSSEQYENVYNQHKCAIFYLLEAIKNKQIDLLNKAFPVEKKLHELEIEFPEDQVTEDILIFSVGGWTFEEAFNIYRFNRENQGKFRVSLAGTSCLNSELFLADLNRLV